MEREVLFRGLRTDGKGWVYGSFVKEMYNSYIVECVDQTRYALSNISVLPESVGQYTGLTDKNGTKIFEGDWIKSAPGYTSVVEFKDGSFISKYSHPEDGEELILTDLNIEGVEIVGNIH